MQPVLELGAEPAHDGVDDDERRHAEHDADDADERQIASLQVSDAEQQLVHGVNFPFASCVGPTGFAVRTPGYESWVRVVASSGD